MEKDPDDSWWCGADVDSVAVELGSHASGSVELRHNSSGGGVERQWQCGSKLYGAGVWRQMAWQ